MSGDLMKQSIGIGTVCVLLMTVAGGVWAGASSYGDVKTSISAEAAASEKTQEAATAEREKENAEIQLHMAKQDDHMEKMEQTLLYHSNTMSAQGAVIDKISGKQDEVASALATTTSEQKEVNEQVLKIRPTRWTYEMQQEFEREIEQHDDNPKLPWPNIQQIHDEFQPQTQ